MARSSAFPASEQAVREEKLREANPNCEKLPGPPRAAEGGLQSTVPSEWPGPRPGCLEAAESRREDAAQEQWTVLENYLKRSCIFMKF